MNLPLPDPPLSGVVITSREIYDAVVRLTGRVDVMIAQQQDAGTRITDHETRLRTLERARWPLPALATVLALGSFGTAVAGFLSGG
jgi:hypothetical protein